MLDLLYCSCRTHMKSDKPVMTAIPPMPFHLLSPCLRTQCFCGVDSDDPTELGAAMCTTDCAGDSSQTCGGRNAISVYAYDTLPTPPVYLGCWQDSGRNRIMDVMQSDSFMTNDVSRFPQYNNIVMPYMVHFCSLLKLSPSTTTGTMQDWSRAR